MWDKYQNEHLAVKTEAPELEDVYVRRLKQAAQNIDKVVVNIGEKAVRINLD